MNIKQNKMEFIYPRLMRFFIICTIFFLNESAYAQKASDSKNKTVKILTVGNSFANNACLFLPQITESVPKCQIRIEKANLGGCTLARHAGLIQKCSTDSGFKAYRDSFCLVDLLQKDQYDYVTIQQASPLSFIEDSLEPFASNLITFIKTYAPQSEIMIHQTWAYSPKCDRLNTWQISRDSMHKGLVKTYSALVNRYSLRMLPSGNAFYSAYKKDGDSYLWSKDGYHANDNGCYLAGCIWFGVLFNISPKKIKFIPQGMDNQTAKYLRKVAEKEIKKLKNI